MYYIVTALQSRNPNPQAVITKVRQSPLGKDPALMGDAQLVVDALTQFRNTGTITNDVAQRAWFQSVDLDGKLRGIFIDMEGVGDVELGEFAQIEEILVHVPDFLALLDVELDITADAYGTPAKHLR